MRNTSLEKYVQVCLSHGFLENGKVCAIIVVTLGSNVQV